MILISPSAVQAEHSGATSSLAAGARQADLPIDAIMLRMFISRHLLLGYIPSRSMRSTSPMDRKSLLWPLMAARLALAQHQRPPTQQFHQRQRTLEYHPQQPIRLLLPQAQAISRHPRKPRRLPAQV